MIKWMELELQNIKEELNKFSGIMEKGLERRKKIIENLQLIFKNIYKK